MRPPNERGRPGEKAASQKITGGRSENHSNVTDTQTNPCHTDEFGLIDLACMRELLAAETRAYARGFTAGRESVYADIEADVARIARNAAKSIDVMAARARSDSRWSA